MADDIAIPTDPRFQDLRGQRFGRWLVTAYAGRRGYNHQWGCVCDCGATGVVQGHSLKRGDSISCGCWKAEVTAARSTVHGHAGRRTRPSEYNIWKSMVARCHKTYSSAFRLYGARGITVCDRWRFGEDGVTGFECFLADMGFRPTPFHSIDRRDNDGGYRPDNCYWATSTEQSYNRRTTRRFPFEGQLMTTAEISERFGISSRTLMGRLACGWPMERAISEPLHYRGQDKRK